jgi:23S rRNA (uracil1939-C5)-methyltransferase
MGACAYFGLCGGCELQDKPYEEQIAEKTALFTKLMRNALDDAAALAGNAELPPLKIAASSPFEYRNRVELHRLPEAPPPRRIKKLNVPREESGAAQAGFMAQKSNSVIPITDCPVCDPAIRDALKNKRLLIPPEKNRWNIFAKDDVFLSEGGKKRGKIRVLDKKITVDASVFFQSNVKLLEKLIEDLLETAGEAAKNGPIWDLYSGVGTFALFLQPYFSRILLMEANKNALLIAKENIEQNAPNTLAEFFALNSEAWIKEMKKRKKLEDPVFVCADPPREGLSREVCDFLSIKKPDVFAYISCNPAALARDSKLLISGGFTLKKLYFYDFYPQTRHIESMAIFICNK